MERLGVSNVRVPKAPVGYLLEVNHNNDPSNAGLSGLHHIHGLSDPCYRRRIFFHRWRKPSARANISSFSTSLCPQHPATVGPPNTVTIIVSRSGLKTCKFLNDRSLAVLKFVQYILSVS